MSKPHVLEKLRGKIEGDLFLDLPQRLLFHTSSSSNAVVPSAVVRPKTSNDVATLIDLCREEGIPVTPRGAGTGMSGANLGAGVVFDFCRYFRTISEIDSKSGKVRVQPGVVYGDLNRTLEPSRLFFPPDPSSGAYCTIGGMVANNAAGAHTVKYGPTRDFVLAVEGVNAWGETVRFEPIDLKGENDFANFPTHMQRTLRNVLVTLRENRGVIEGGYPKVTKNASGYLLQEVLREKRLDLPKLLCGSEGSLLVFTAIELKVVSLPTRRGVAFAAFNSLEQAGEAVIAARALNPSALEILDRSLIQAILKTRLSVAEKLPAQSEAALLIEFEGEADSEVEKALKRVTEVLRPLALTVVSATDPKEQKKIWDLRRAAAVKARREDWKKPIRVIEDAAVPIHRIADYIRGARRILARHNAEAILVGHAGNGNIHVEPLLDVRAPDLKETVQELASEVSDLVRDLGGTLSGEHGDGIIRSPYLPKIYPELYPVFEQIKKSFDPAGTLNPGVILPYPKLRRLEDELRYDFTPVKTGTVFDDLHHEVERCFSCGACRNYCPAYGDSGEEERLPRARAALLRGLIGGVITAGELFSSKEAKNVFELCFNCGRCAPECPAGFDSARLSTIAKEYFEKAQPINPVENLLTSPKVFGSLLQSTPAGVRELMNAPVMRKLAAPTCGLTSERKLPHFGEKSFRELLSQRTPKPGTREKLVYFPGCYAEFNDPIGEGLGTLTCLEENGFSVEVPKFECCGIAQLTTSGFSRTQTEAEKNIRDLGEKIHEGKKIVFSSPSCGHAVTEEYPYFLMTDESREVAKGSIDACKLLANLLEMGELKKPAPLRIRAAYHNPCHLRVRGLGPEAITLLRAIPEFELVEMPDRCCGMAGTFGAKERHYEKSMAIGAPQIESVNRAQVQVVVTGCGTCQMQMEHGTELPSVHPLAILAAAYGAKTLPSSLKI